ncbi:ATP-dependent DNA helicase RecG [bacterium]|nr:ATP-dependent DNA helicase RecG [bacterium]
MTPTPDSQNDPLARPLQLVPGVGPQRLKLLQRCGLKTVLDAANYFPYRHEDRSEITYIRSLADGEAATVHGIVDSIASRVTRSRKRIVQVGIRDATGVIYGVWFNQPWMQDKFREGRKVLFTGKVQLDPFPSMANPQVEFLPDDFSPDEYEGAVVPVYRLTEDISPMVMRKIIHAALDAALPHIREYLPSKVLAQYHLIDLPEAYRVIHAWQCPAGQLTQEHLARARRRLVMDEFFVITMGLLMKRARTVQLPYSIAHKPPGDLVRAFISRLPFSLTAAQKRVLREIKDDLLAPHPMNRLLHGDVGSGKTVVALTAMLIAVEGGYQAAIMAPTEVLARQHHKTIRALLDGLTVPVRILTGTTRGAERKEVLAALRSGEPGIAIGTHALIQAGVGMPRLGLAVIDEQHKFGVMQRNRLRDQAEQTDVLVMTATPIPRSLALTVYGDLSVSKIDELPAGRRPVHTYVVREDLLPRVWQFVRKQVRQGRQAFVVYPLIDESDTMPLKPATVMFEHLRDTVFPDLRIGLIHGRMAAPDKEDAMRAFARGETNVLVCTTVIEVGIDVPNATVMVVEEAQRFGLAQLHQLRGRIGRGGHESYCILIDQTTEEQQARTAGRTPRQGELLELYANSRLAALARTNDGFEIAEDDLRLRGPGEFFGIEQTGLPALHIADLIRDEEELKLARHLAETLLQYRNQLTAETRAGIRERLRRAFGSNIRGVDAG